MRKIDLNNWTLFSSRKNSKNYVSTDGSKLLKASSDFKTFKLEELEDELFVANVAYDMGIKTPRPGIIVEMPDGTPALVTDYVQNKKSFSRYISEHPESMEDMMKLFAREAKVFHGTPANKKLVMSFEDAMVESLNASSIYNYEEKKIILDKIRRLPSADTVLHGDFQPSNILLSGNDVYWIDLSEMTYGNPLYDIGFLWYVVTKSNDRVFDRVFHTDAEGAYKMWKAFAKEYFETENLAAVEKLVKPYAYAGINLILKVMPNTGFITYNKDEILEECRK